MFKSSKSSLSSAQTLIALLNELQEVTKSVIKILQHMEKQKIEIPLPSWIMNQTVSAKIAMVQVLQACLLMHQRSIQQKSPAALKTEQLSEVTSSKELDPNTSPVKR